MYFFVFPFFCKKQAILRMRITQPSVTQLVVNGDWIWEIIRRLQEPEIGIISIVSPILLILKYPTCFPKKGFLHVLRTKEEEEEIAFFDQIHKCEIQDVGEYSIQRGIGSLNRYLQQKTTSQKFSISICDLQLHRYWFPQRFHFVVPKTLTRLREGNQLMWSLPAFLSKHFVTAMNANG